jgi:hypothetical protein
VVWQKRYSPPGSAPGTLRPAPQSKHEVRITAIHYNAEHYHEESVADLDAYLQSAPRTGVQWLNIDGHCDCLYSPHFCRGHLRHEF